MSTHTLSETEWSSASEPSILFRHVKPLLGPDDRKYRLLFVALARHCWGALTPQIRLAVEVGERFADGQARDLDLQKAYNRVVRSNVLAPFSYAAFASWPTECRSSLSRMATQFTVPIELAQAAGDSDHSQLCALIRDLIGNPYRPVTLDDVATRGLSEIRKMADAMYQARDFTAMPVLADALEDADCHSAGLIAHCRQPGTHVRGCWAVDLLLGRPPIRATPS